jgi:hypothetical protein
LPAVVSILIAIRIAMSVCRPNRKLFAARLRQIGQGTWVRDGVSKRLATGERGLELWRSKVTKGGRIIWQVCRLCCMLYGPCMGHVATVALVVLFRSLPANAPRPRGGYDGLL